MPQRSDAENSPILRLLFAFVVMNVLQTGRAHTFNCNFGETIKHVQKYGIEVENTQQFHQQNWHSRRFLQGLVRNPIRITLDVTDFNTIKTTPNGQPQTTAARLAFIRRAMQVTEAFYESRLKVSTVTRVVAPSVCGGFAPSGGDTSVGISSSDLHIYVRYITDKNVSYNANGISCAFVTGRSLPDSTFQQGRPIVGRIIFNTNKIIDQQTSLTSRLFAEITSTALHETMHILGFDSSLFSTYLNPANGNRYVMSSILQQVQLDSNRNPNYILKTPSVIDWTQRFFACGSIAGMALENEDGGAIGSHWQRLSMYDQLMTGTQLGAQKGFSGLTFALLKDMGWYEVDDSWNDTSNYGKDMGCDFYNLACNMSAATPQYSQYFCDVTAFVNVSTCATNFLSKAICINSDAMSDQCGIFGGYFHCVDPAQANDGYRSYTLEKYSTDSFCVESTFANIGITDKYRGRCYPYQCFSNYVVFSINSFSVTCTQAEGSTVPPTQKTLSGLNGFLICPNFQAFCKQSRQICPNWCSQNGFCTRGICNCLPGFFGADCSKNNCANGTFYDETTFRCVASCPTLTYSNIYSRACLPCSAACTGGCRDEPHICTNCTSTPGNRQYYIVSESRCGAICPNYTFVDGDFCTDCSGAAGSNCATCSQAANNCTSCLSGFLQNPNFGSCQSTCPPLFNLYDIPNKKCVSTCTGNLIYYPSNCTGCPNSNLGNCNLCPFGSYKFIQNQTCGLNCPSTYYKNETGRFCQKCHVSCLECNGSFAENCTQCSNASANSYLLSGMCVPSCPVGYSQNRAAGRCQVCDPTLNCASCQRLSNGTIQCLSCMYGFFLQLNKTCLGSCDDTYFKNTWNRTCDRCSTPTCNRCTGSSSSSCLDCVATRLFLQNITGGFCVTSCPIDYFYQSGSNCINCHVTCRRCSGPNSNQCSRCIQGLYLSIATVGSTSGLCRYVCPPKTFPNSVTGTCDACHNDCSFCFGATVDNCTACVSGLVLNNFTCASSCPQGLAVNQWNVCFEEMLKRVFYGIGAIMVFLAY